MRSTKTHPRSSHENGPAPSHHRVNDARDQAFTLRSSRGFESTESYVGFAGEVVAKRNRLVQAKLGQKHPQLRLLPPAPVPEYANRRVVGRSAIQAVGRTCTVPCRSIGGGGGLLVRRMGGSVLEDDLLELMEPVGESGTAWSITAASSAPPGRGQGQALVRKPGAFARHCFGEQRFRPANFRLADDSLRQCRGSRTTGGTRTCR